MTDKLRKYVIPNLPYVLVGWFCLKLGTVYRLATGANIGLKLIGTMKTIGPAIGTIAPGLDPFDWLIGITGAALLRLVIYNKVKKAKSFEGMWSTDRRVGADPKILSRSSIQSFKTM